MRAIRPILVLLPMLALSAAAWAGPKEDGYAALSAKNYDEAARLLGQARVADPGDTRLGDALGTALYRAGRYREAEQIFSALAESTTDGEDAARARYNAGNAAYRGGRLDQALSAYQQAMGQDAQFKDAQTNAAAVQKEIQARRSPPPEDQQDQQDQEDQQEQDQQKQAGQDGQQDQEGQPQDGQSGQDGQKPDPGDGTRQADATEPKDGEPEDGNGNSKPGEPKDGQGERPADGEPKDGAVAQDEAGEPGGEGTEVASGEPGDDGGMTAQEATQLVESVQDGKPRVVVGRPSGGKDW